MPKTRKSLQEQDRTGLEPLQNRSGSGLPSPERREVAKAGNCGTARKGWRKGRPSGFASPTRKLTDEQAIEIRYRVGGERSISERAAAREYGVSVKTVRGILAGKLYKTPKPKPIAPPLEPTVLRFELVSVRPKPADQSGRSYALAPLKQQRMA